jgi:hypothetical protein
MRRDSIGLRVFLVIGGGRILGVLKVDGVGPNEARARHGGECDCSRPMCLFYRVVVVAWQDWRVLRVMIVFVEKKNGKDCRLERASDAITRSFLGFRSPVCSPDTAGGGAEMSA